MTKFGVIPTHLICRFGELTKTEIIVISYLYAARNGQSGLCNPKQKAIAISTRINKSHVSLAIKNLENKGWLLQDSEGSFLLNSELPEVTKSATTELPNPQPKVTSFATKGLPNSQLVVTESVTQVAESVTKSYEIGNLLNKEMNKQVTNNEQTSEQREESIAPDHEMVRIYRDVFPENFLSVYLQDLVMARIENAQVWRAALDFWAGNSYRPGSVARICDYYDELLAGKQNGTNSHGPHRSKRTDQDVLRESAEFYANYPESG